MVDPTSSLLQDLIESWSQSLEKERGFSRNTVIAYSQDLLGWLAFLQDHFGEVPTLETLTKVKVRDYRAFLTKRLSDGITHRSNRRTLSALRTFFHDLKLNHGVDHQGVFNVSLPRFTKTLPRPLKVSEAQEVVDYKGLGHEEPWVMARNQALFSLLYGCGLRISEGLSLTPSHLPLGQTLKIKGKGDKERMVPVLPLVREAIQKYVEMCPYSFPLDCIFLGVRGGKLSPQSAAREMQKIREDLVLPKTASPHSLRHSFASHLLQGGANLRTIQELLGHQSLSSTQIYTKVEDDQLLSQFHALHPRGDKKNTAGD